ncbi:hypothetical protein [Laspinema olomoucense]|uniref:hypothetical protein n=1 Tax=Laspinema olomoucense TaxID=3231600 RepID=UPI0021BB19AC|nr:MULTISPECIES: hypothetical protein [unclassified Laspinema]MCT7971524.1 hypothetical protein [Laspinema sp. D3d]MCT7990952.1 hypothetical protein [Laspinema sp. D3a]MCT7995435.1 hypothetical protein [Laspinema sp. D3c]
MSDWNKSPGEKKTTESGDCRFLLSGTQISVVGAIAPLEFLYVVYSFLGPPGNPLGNPHRVPKLPT